MKKIFIFISLLLIFSVLLSFSVFALQESIYKIRLGNETLIMKYPIIMQDDRIYVSLREICDKLRIPIEWNEKENEAHIDINNKKILVSDKSDYKEEGVIPDEETAYQVGKTILERYVNRPLEYETENYVYSLGTTFLEDENAWIVYQDMRYKKGPLFIRSKPDLIEIKLSKNTGEVLFISTYSIFSDSE